MRFPSRRMPATRFPNAAVSGGSTDRRRNGLFTRTRSSGSPDHARREALDVDGHVGELGHRAILASRSARDKVADFAHHRPV